MKSGDWLEDYKHVPELYRARAQSNAALVATGAAALAAGAVFGGASNLSSIGRAAALVSIVLLLGSVGFFVAAANHVDDSDVDPEEVQGRVKAVVRAIRFRSKVASIAAVAAVVAFVVVVGSTVLPKSDRVSATIFLSDRGASLVDSACALPTNNRVNAMLKENALADSTSYVSLLLPADQCKKDPVELVVSQTDIEMAQVD